MNKKMLLETIEELFDVNFRNEVMEDVKHLMNSGCIDLEEFGDRVGFLAKIILTAAINRNSNYFSVSKKDTKNLENV